MCHRLRRVDEQWVDQFRGALIPGGGGDDVENNNRASFFALLAHLMSFFWKVCWNLKCAICLSQGHRER